MKTSFHTFFALAALVAVGARAQLQTFDTRPSYTGSAITFDQNGTLGQTFSNVSAVKSMTFNFFTGTGGSSVATNVNAVFGQWNGSGFVNGSTVNFGTISIPASNTGGWTGTLANNGGSFTNFQYTFDLTSVTSGLIDATYGYLTDPTKTYAMMLTDTYTNANPLANSGLALGLTNNNAFAYGAADGFGTKDWTFAQLVVAPGSQNLSSVPEPATVASICGAVLVGGLGVLRKRQRKLAVAAVA